MKSFYFILIWFGLFIQGQWAAGSALLSEAENEKVKGSIFSKALKDLDVKSLTIQEKEWIHETSLLDGYNSTLESYKKFGHSFGGYEDLSRLSGELADYYTFKGNTTLASQYYLETARWVLEASLLGSANHLAYLQSLYREHHLNKETWNIIEKNAVYEENDQPGELLNNAKEFREIQMNLATTFQSMIRNRIENGQNSEPLFFDKIINSIFQDSIKEEARKGKFD